MDRLKITGTRLTNPDPSRYRVEQRYRKGQHPIVLLREQKTSHLILACRVRLSLHADAADATARALESTLLQIRHPALPRLLETRYDRDMHAYWYLFEGEEGDSLDTRLEQAGADEILNWSAQVLEALAVLHAQDPPLIVGTLSAHTVLIGTHGARLLDVGLQARLFPESVAMELKDGRALNPQADVEAVRVWAGASAWPPAATAAEAAASLQPWLKRASVPAASHPPERIPPREVSTDMVRIRGARSRRPRAAGPRIAASVLVLAVLAIAVQALWPAPHAAAVPISSHRLLHVTQGRMRVYLPTERPQWQPRSTIDETPVQVVASGTLDLQSDAPEIQLHLTPDSSLRIEQCNDGILKASLLHGDLRIVLPPDACALLRTPTAVLKCDGGTDLDLTESTARLHAGHATFQGKPLPLDQTVSL